MTERRRFFPARSVQQVPGQTVGLQVRLLPQVAAAVAEPASGGGDGGGTGVGPALLVEPWDYTAHRDIVNRTYDDWRVVAGDVEINPELAQPFRAVYVGGSADIDWAWELDRSPLDEGAIGDWGGVTVEVQDGTALITVAYGYATVETFMHAVLTLTASLGGETLGTVSLRLAFNLYSE